MDRRMSSRWSQGWRELSARSSCAQERSATGGRASDEGRAVGIGARERVPLGPRGPQTVDMRCWGQSEQVVIGTDQSCASPQGSKWSVWEQERSRLSVQRRGREGPAGTGAKPTERSARSKGRSLQGVGVEERSGWSDVEPWVVSGSEPRLSP